MLTDRIKVENVLNKAYEEFRHNKSLVKELCQRMIKYNVMPGVTALIIQQQKGLQELTEEMLFWLLKETHDLLKTKDYNQLNNLKVDKYYTDKELALYSTSALPEKDTKQFPIVFKNIVQVENDQWFVTVDIDFIKHLRDTQVVVYNRRTQRQMAIQERIGREPLYKINVVERSVKEIKDLMVSGQYIPHPITLNMNADKEVDFAFDGKQNILVVKKAQIDIIDGYHNYLAMLRAYDENSNFTYRCPINLMLFSESKAGMYIAQEDKKNKINKSYVESLDYSKKGNLVVKKLSEDEDSLLKGIISRFDGVINYTDLADNINFNWNPKTALEEFTISAQLKKYFNELVMKYNYLFSEVKSFKDICIMVRAIKYCIESNIPVELSADMVNTILFKSTSIDEHKFKNKIVRKTLFKDVDELIRGVVNV